MLLLTTIVVNKCQEKKFTLYTFYIAFVELAEILGVTYQQVQRYENGLNKLNVENIQVIADALDAPVSYFFGNGKKDLVSEGSAGYLPLDESKLLGYFRRIKAKKLKSLVFQVAKLATKARV